MSLVCFLFLFLFLCLALFLVLLLLLFQLCSATVDPLPSCVRCVG